MITEEYRKELEDWVNNHTEYYNEYVRTMKNSKRATLATYMHIYDYAMRRIPGLPTSVELGACSYLFRNYYEKYGFSDLVGMHFLVVGNDKWLGLKSLAQQKKLKMAISSWLVIGDLQTDIISMIRNHPNKTKYEEALYELETRIIRNSIFSGLNDSKFWSSRRIFDKLLLSKEELKKCIDCCTINISEASKENQQSTNKRGRKTKFDDLKDKSLEGLIEYSMGSRNNVDSYVGKIVQELEHCTTGEDLAALTIALEYCEIIKSVDKGGVNMFWKMLHDKCATIVCYESMLNNYNELVSFHNNGKVPHKCAEGRKKISEYIETFQEMKKQLENRVQETFINAN